MVIAAIFLIVPLCLAFAAVNDLITMTIPNRVSAILLGSFIIVAPFTGMDWQTFGMSLLAGLVILAACFAFFAMNAMGGGDAKILAASAVWFGFNISLTLFMVYVAFIGGLLTIAIIVIRSRSQEIMAVGLPIPNSLLVAKKIPYGIAIAIAGLLTYPEAPIVQLAMRSLM
jgi:prepilin peptidase CpaA